MSDQPAKSKRYEVTERVAGTGRISYPGSANPQHVESADSLLDAALQGSTPVRGAHGEGVHAGVLTGVATVSANAAATGRGALSGEQVQARPAMREGADFQRGLCGNEHVMEAVEAVRQHPLYQECLRRIAKAERERAHCLHQMNHAIDVARIAYIRVLERRMPFRKEVVYAAALLHDAGKAVQYETDEPHEIAGARIAAQILADIEGFSALEKTAMVAAVAQHRAYSEDSSPLGKLLFEADKVSRPCFACASRATCTWAEDKKNAGVKI